MAELAIHCADGLSLEGLIKLAIRNADCEDYLTCDNKNESLESLLKRAFSIGDDGTYALNVCGCSGGVEPVEGLTEVTYAELVALIGSSGLTPGGFYLLTDFATVHYMLDGLGSNIMDGGNEVINTGGIEPLILFALSNNKISHEAYSPSYPQDKIYYDWDSANWLTDLSFEISGTIIPNFKGVIYFRHSTNNDISTGYDFRNVKYRRWSVVTTWGNKYLSPYEGAALFFEAEAEQVYDDFLTFNCPDGGNQFDNEVRDVHIVPFRDDEIIWKVNPTILNNNVFHLLSNQGAIQVSSINIGKYSAVNTFVGYNGTLDFRSQLVTSFFNSAFDMSFLTSYIVDCYFDTCAYNTFYGDNDYLYIGTNTRHNIFESGVSFIKLPDKSVGNGCRYTTFKSNVRGTSSLSLLDFSAANLVFTNYNKVIQNREDGTAKLSYINNSDVLTIVAATA